MNRLERSAAWHTAAWRVFGTASVAVGIVNAFIPLLPTTVFLLVGAWAWGRGAPEWRLRLLAHPRWGEPLRLWENGRQVSRRGKRMATVGMATSWVLSAVSIGPTTAVSAAGLGLAALLAWLWWRPEPGPVSPGRKPVARGMDLRAPAVATRGMASTPRGDHEQELHPRITGRARDPPAAATQPAPGGVDDQCIRTRTQPT